MTSLKDFLNRHNPAPATKDMADQVSAKAAEAAFYAAVARSAETADSTATAHPVSAPPTRLPHRTRWLALSAAATVVLLGCGFAVHNLWPTGHHNTQIAVKPHEPSTPASTVPKKPTTTTITGTWLLTTSIADANSAKISPGVFTITNDQDTGYTLSGTPSCNVVRIGLQFDPKNPPKPQSTNLPVGFTAPTITQRQCQPDYMTADTTFLQSLTSQDARVGKDIPVGARQLTVTADQLTITKPKANGVSELTFIRLPDEAELTTTPLQGEWEAASAALTTNISEHRSRPLEFNATGKNTGQVTGSTNCLDLNLEYTVTGQSWTIKTAFIRTVHADDPQCPDEIHSTAALLTNQLPGKTFRVYQNQHALVLRQNLTATTGVAPQDVVPEEIIMVDRDKIMRLLDNTKTG